MALGCESAFGSDDQWKEMAMEPMRAVMLGFVWALGKDMVSGPWSDCQSDYE